LGACIKYTCPIGHVYFIHASKWTRVLLHVSIWTRVFNTRVRLDACIQYTCPIGRVYYYTRPIGHVYVIHAPNWTRVRHTRVQFWHVFDIHVPKCYCVTIWHVSPRHVSNLTRVYSNKYCRHASKCCNFCSVSHETICIHKEDPTIKKEKELRTLVTNMYRRLSWSQNVRQFLGNFFFETCELVILDTFMSMSIIDSTW